MALDRDTSGYIFRKLPAVDKLRLGHVFNEHKPSQFQVSSELISEKPFKGMNGLIMRALTTGDYEPCVKAMTSIQKNHMHPEHLVLYESDTRVDFRHYDPYQRVERLSVQLARLPKKK